MTSTPLKLGVDRWSLLALLRFALAFIVAVNHLAEYATLGPLAWIPKFGAFEAILGFLLVSGYAVGASYRKSPDGFYLRRAWRVYPVYLASMVITFIATPAELTPSLLAVLALNLLFLNQLFTTTSYVGPAWSLSLEVWLYAITPVLARLSPERIRWLVMGSLAFYVANTCGRTLFHWPYPAWQGWGLNILTLAFPWLLGFLLSNPQAAKRPLLRWIALALAVHVALALVIQFGFRLKHAALDSFWGVDAPEFVFRSLTLLAVWWCLRYAVTPASAGVKRTRSAWLVLMGDVSYPLYLTHIPVAVICNSYGIRDPYLILGAMMCFASVIYLLVDSYSRGREKRALISTRVLA
jgi:peptidoglycan/LPS O-acetylase OafA/YrhL